MPPRKTEPQSTLESIAVEQLLEPQIFVAVLAQLAARGVPPKEAVIQAQEYAKAGSALYD